ncbi:hypothetical protein GCM10009754_05420 [Amycolatopsis minnesotensis]|uniref:Uncharacterized protein n=2 Tax=Amycolatopsis minnesotensis TaxID=337894 RepID=A0ABN2Q130_9PSEU
MHGYWLGVTGAALLTVALPIVWETLVRRPPAAARAQGWAVALAVTVLGTAALLDWARVPAGWLLALVLVGETGAVALFRTARRRWLRWQHTEQERLYTKENLASGPWQIWTRPHRERHSVPSSRVDRWLAADGPAPTAGWWHHGGLTVGAHGPALLDAAGVPHRLPEAVTTMIHLPVPHALLLVDDAQTLLAWLPTAGFADPELREYCRVAGWRYADRIGFGHEDRHALDLRPCVADTAAHG